MTDRGTDPTEPPAPPDFTTSDDVTPSDGVTTRGRADTWVVEGPITPEPRSPGPAWDRLVTGLLLLAVGVIWMLHEAGAIEVDGRAAVPAALLVVGIAVIVVSLGRHAGGLIGLGVVLTILVLISAIAPDDLSAGIGERIERPTTPAELAELDDDLSHGMGQLTLDLSAVSLERDVEVEANVGIGELRVVVPNDIRVEVMATAGVGDVVVLGESRGGIGAERNVVVDDVGLGPAGPTLRLDLAVGIGEIEVTR